MKLRRYEQLRPDELEDVLRASPIAYWPLGLIEHHGWHLPIGFDGIKAERICGRAAEQTGGVILPVMWWGGLGGHDQFKWTHYQPPGAAGEIVATTVGQLFTFGFRAVVVLAGHYPWQSILDERLPPIAKRNADRHLLWGTEVTIAPDGSDPRTRGDHAAREETSMGLSLLPELTDASAASRRKRGDEIWTGGKRPSDVPASVETDVSSPVFGQWIPEGGQDSRAATPEHGEEIVAAVVARIVRAIRA